MSIFLIVAAVALGAVFFLIKTGKIEDKDGNNVPDVIDNKIKQTKEVAKEVKARAKRVSEEAADVVKAVKEVAKQTKDVVEAAKGEKRKGKKTTKK